MRALLDTNIIIHRENTRAVSNYSIGYLYKWLDALGIEKAIHPLSIEEIEGFGDESVKELLRVKIDSYTKLISKDVPDQNFIDKLGSNSQKSKNDHVDNCLLFEVYIGHVDILITEDRALVRKAQKIGLADKVYTINRFIEECSSNYPDQIDYRVLGVKQKYFGEIDLRSPFFDSFRRDYDNFDKWFNGKCNSKAYVAEDDIGNIFGFLYIKTEDADEPYYDIYPIMEPKKRLKVGTFKVESTGFRLGERFIKIIFDHAILYNVDEIYVTLFADKEDIAPLGNLLLRWGFTRFGFKETINGKERVLTKTMRSYRPDFSIRRNFPNLQFNKQKFILPIEPKYHTDLCPDAILKSESPDDFVGNKACRYALQKVYISFSFVRNANPGDFILMYRKGQTTPKAHTSVLTNIGIINKTHHSFACREDYLNCCKNRTVFTLEELNSFWDRKQSEILVVDFIFLKKLEQNVPLKFLWDERIVEYPKGPRPFTRISDEAFCRILEESKTTLSHLY